MIEGDRLNQLRKVLSAVAVLFCLLSPTSLRAARGWFAQQRPPRIARQNRAWRRARIARDKHQHAAGFFKRLRDLPPAQQDRILRNDARFHNLPPARRRQIRANLQRWNSLTPHQKQVLRQREEIVRSLSPAQRQDLKAVFPEYRRLSPVQQQQVMRAFRRLRNMPPAKRQRLMNNPRFEQRFTARQQNVLRGLNGLLQGSSADSP